MHLDATARQVYARQRATGANRWDAALVALNPNPNGPVMQANRAVRRAWDFALDRFEDFCDLVDHAVIFPAEKHVAPRLDEIRDQLTTWHLGRLRWSIRRQVQTLPSFAHAEDCARFAAEVRQYERDLHA